MLKELIGSLLLFFAFGPFCIQLLNTPKEGPGLVARQFQIMCNLPRWAPMAQVLYAFARAVPLGDSSKPGQVSSASILSNCCSDSEVEIAVALVSGCSLYTLL